MSQFLPLRPAAGQTLLRLALGVMWIAHALLKIFVFTLPGTAQFFGAHGFAPVLAYPVTVLELVGGVVILLGFHARLASLLLMPILAGALFVHVPNGWVFTAPGGGWEYPLFLLLASAVHVLGGDGELALRSA